MMQLRILIFAGVRKALQADHITVDVPKDATVSDVRRALEHEYPQLAPMIRNSQFALDEQFATDTSLVKDTAEVAWIPPVSGG